MFGHTGGHSRLVFRCVGSKHGRKTSQGDGFSDRCLSQTVLAGIFPRLAVFCTLMDDGGQEPSNSALAGAAG